MIGHLAQRGTTLIELVVSIVIISIATLGLTLAVSATAGRSADPMIEAQALAIAQGYLEEVAQGGFCDPEFNPDLDPATKCQDECKVSACGSCAGPAFGSESNRTAFDDVCDYDGLADIGARDRTGAAIADLGSYDVTVTIHDRNLNLGSPALRADAGETLRIDVAVTHPSLSAPVNISAYKTNLQ